jgi:hypothetical protein
VTNLTHSLICHSLIHRGIAQLVEWRSPKPQAAGSSPAAPAQQKISLSLKLFPSVRCPLLGTTNFFANGKGYFVSERELPRTAQKRVLAHGCAIAGKHDCRVGHGRRAHPYHLFDGWLEQNRFQRDLRSVNQTLGHQQLIGQQQLCIRRLAYPQQRKKKDGTHSA